MQLQLKSASRVIYASWLLLGASVIASIITIFVVLAFDLDGYKNQCVFFEQLSHTRIVLIPYISGIICIIIALTLPAIKKQDGSKIAAIGGFLAILYFFVIPYIVPGSSQQDFCYEQAPGLEIKAALK